MQEKLRQIGDKSEVKEFRSVAGGGDINNAYYVKTEKNKYFIKTNEKVPSDFFQLEAKGLEQFARQTRSTYQRYTIMISLQIMKKLCLLWNG